MLRVRKMRKVEAPFKLFHSPSMCMRSNILLKHGFRTALGATVALVISSTAFELSAGKWEQQRKNGEII